MEQKEKRITKRKEKEILFGSKALTSGIKVKSKIGGPEMLIKGFIACDKTIETNNEQMQSVNSTEIGEYTIYEKLCLSGENNYPFEIHDNTKSKESSGNYKNVLVICYYYSEKNE